MCNNVDTLSEVEIITKELVKMLSESHLTITTAESCTGGMISSTIVNIPGTSSVLNEAYVTYANEAKMKILGVKRDTLDVHGAVSEETAYEMVVGVAKAAQADCAIAVTGIAGPDGGTDDKPVGTVYAGFYYKGNVEVVRYNFDGDRYEVRSKTTRETLKKMIELIVKFEKKV